MALAQTQRVLDYPASGGVICTMNHMALPFQKCGGRIGDGVGGVKVVGEYPVSDTFLHRCAKPLIQRPDKYKRSL